MSDLVGRSNDQYYRREFKHEKSLYEETSNLGAAHTADNSCFDQPHHYLIFILVALLFLGSICLLALDLLFGRYRNNEPATRRRVVAKTPLPSAPPRVIVDDAEDMSDAQLRERRHYNTPVSPADLQI